MFWRATVRAPSFWNPSIVHIGLEFMPELQRANCTSLLWVGHRLAHDAAEAALRVAAKRSPKSSETVWRGATHRRALLESERAFSQWGALALRRDARRLQAARPPASL